MASKLEEIRQAALRAGWTVEPHGYMRQLGITAVHGSESIGIDLDHRGALYGWTRYRETENGDRVVLAQSRHSDVDKLGAVIDELESGWAA